MEREVSFRARQPSAAACVGVYFHWVDTLKCVPVQTSSRGSVASNFRARRLNSFNHDATGIDPFSIGREVILQGYNWPNDDLMSIAAKPCIKSRLPLAKVGGVLEGVRETVAWYSYEKKRYLPPRLCPALHPYPLTTASHLQPSRQYLIIGGLLTWPPEPPTGRSTALCRTAPHNLRVSVRGTSLSGRARAALPVLHPRVRRKQLEDGHRIRVRRAWAGPGPRARNRRGRRRETQRQ